MILTQFYGGFNYCYIHMDHVCIKQTKNEYY